MEVDGKGDTLIEWKKIFNFNKRYMKNENYRLFFWAVDERSFQFVEVRRLVDEVVEFVICGRVLDVINDGFQDIDAEGTRSQFLIKSQMDDALKDGNDSPELVCVRDDLGNGSIDTEMESILNLELLDFVTDVFNHLV